MTEFIIVAVLGILAQFFLMGGGAKYAKYLIKARDYLNALFPIEIYPKGIAFEGRDATLFNANEKKVMVKPEDVKAASKSHGFNLKIK